MMQSEQAHAQLLLQTADESEADESQQQQRFPEAAPAGGGLAGHPRLARSVGVLSGVGLAMAVFSLAYSGIKSQIPGGARPMLHRLAGGGPPAEPLQLPFFMLKEATWSAPFPSQCGEIDVDFEMMDNSGWGVGLDHIADPEVCCAICQGVPQCKSFTWVKDAGLDGCPSQCWLKGGSQGKVARKGFVSGVPAPRKDFQAVPQMQSLPGASLYCFSLMVPGTDEQKLLAWQIESSASIFGCDASAVFSNISMQIGGWWLFGGVWTKVIDSKLQCGYGGDSGTALNAWIFIALFDTLLKDGEWANHDWSVKVDPDAVFFPDRLVNLLQGHQGEAYINNCKFGMHGPIEVFGKKAMEALDKDYKSSWDGKAPATCVKGLEFGGWGEDMFLDQCLQKLGLKAPLDERLLCEDHCECPAWFWCTNGTDRVSFHPFKTVDSYKNCIANAMAT